MTKKNTSLSDFVVCHYDFSHLYNTKHVFFSPVHISRRHLLGTSLKEKILNTRDIILGSEPEGSGIQPLHRSKITIQHRQSGSPEVLRSAEYTLKPGLIDVATLGLFIIVPSMIHSIARLVSLEWLLYNPDREEYGLLFIISGLFLVVELAVAVSSILMLGRWALGCALTCALAPLVAAVHGLCAAINWVMSNPSNEKTKDKMVEIDSFFALHGVNFNRIDVHYTAHLAKDQLIIKPTLDNRYSYALDEIEAGYSDWGPYEDKLIKKNSQELKEIDLSSLVQSDLNAIREALKIYEQRGLLRLEDNTKVLDDECSALSSSYCSL